MAQYTSMWKPTEFTIATRVADEDCTCMVCSGSQSREST